MSSVDLSSSEARRVALAAQGFDRPRPHGRVDVRHLRRVIHQLGLLQIDYVNVLVPAQYQVPFSRVGPYDRTRLDELVYRRREFTEHWAHEASIVPMAAYPLLRYRRLSHRARPHGFDRFLSRDPGYARLVLREVRARGPLAAAALPSPQGGNRRMPGAWLGTVPRAVLEAQFGRGTLAIADRRVDFSRVYDLSERVIPPERRRTRIPNAEAHRTLLRLAARAHGVATAGDLADYYRMPLGLARPRLEELVAAAELREVRVEGWAEPGYLDPAARRPRRIAAAALLSPFDPVVWHRPRAARLFGFDYRIEIFVPAPKRKWGYYVLPFLLGDRLVARVDLKADRPKRRLVVRAAYREPETDAARVADALAGELRLMAGWLGLDAVTVERRGPFARHLSTAVGR
tara:strand:+ start:8744 stop:9949 length:1206 start_codon:yes stop_codon:yes gene_type:complete